MFILQLSYLVFLGMFSFFINTNLAPLGTQPMHVTEYVVWAWSSVMLLDEIRQVQILVENL